MSVGVKSSAGLAASGPGTPILACLEVVKRFGETEALRGASLEVKAGEIVAVMGSSGSGKSTLLHCAAGILVPDDGAVMFNGRSIDKFSDGKRSALRRS